MLTAALKQQIRLLHQHLKTELPGYRSRPGQNQLVAEISKIVAGEYDRHVRLGLIEAGTGTGKSLAYLLATLPYALSQKKTLVVATATVALQEQLTQKELPFLQRHTGLDFEFTLVKGRHRYACIQRLQQRLLQPELFALHSEIPDGQFEHLLQMWQQRQWLGDRDSLPEAISEQAWQLIRADAHLCQQHPAHQNCPFHLARAEINNAQVLVVNHSLLLADLAQNNRILSAPADSIYVIDEAHHLTHCAREHFSSSASLNQNQILLEQSRKQLQSLQGVLNQSHLKDLLRLDDLLSEFHALLKPVLRSMTEFEPRWFTGPEQSHFRFTHAALPKVWQHQAQPLAETTSKADKVLDKLLTELQSQLSATTKVNANQLHILQDLVQLQQRIQHHQQLWQAYAQPQQQPAQQARWISREQQQLTLHSSPLAVGNLLQQLFFKEAFAAVLCSATLQIMQSFDFAKRELGLERTPVQTLAVASPFAYAEQATMLLPATRCEPTDPNFTAEIIRLLPKYLTGKAGTLVLFTSYRQMQDVAQALRRQGYSLLVQGEASRQALLDLHRSKVQGGQSSILFGTQSFAEGLDLPGSLLTELIITKLAFAVPTSPLEEAQAEAIQARGGNAFMQLSIPLTARKLVQACGRLLRQEQDQGRIVILDRRLVSKHYGKAMLASLPPFRCVIEP